MPSTSGAAAAAEAHTPKPVITSVTPTHGSSVGYAHLIIRGRHLKDGTVGSLHYSLTRCPVAGTCISLGVDDHKPDPLLARITSYGTTVTQRVPVPADHDERLADTAYFVGLSCPTATFCAAVGGYNDDTGLFGTWNGSRWTTRSAPTPAGNPDANYLNTVSCGAPSHCVALGDSFVDTFDDGTLASSATHVPAGYSDPRPDRVSCHAASSCTVIGDGDDGKRAGTSSPSATTRSGRRGDCPTRRSGDRRSRPTSPASTARASIAAPCSPVARAPVPAGR